jgi:hypothetical protein
MFGNMLSIRFRLSPVSFRTTGTLTTKENSMDRIVSAVFHSESDARNAVDWLRSNGVSDDAITIVSRNNDTSEGGFKATHGDAEEAKDTGSGALTGMSVGAGVGALFGLAAAVIPGVGPFITAGALASALGVTGGAMASGAIVGATAGTLSGALTGWGVSDHDADYYAGEVERGGVFVGVDTSRANVDTSTIRAAFDRFNGRYSSGMSQAA